jgi:hypothetical protein
MNREKEKIEPVEYPFAKWMVIVLVVAAASVAAFALYCLYTGKTESISLLFVLTATPIGIILHNYQKKIVVERDAILNKNWWGEKRVRFGEMREVHIETNMGGVDIYKNSRPWPHFVVHRAVENYRDVAREIVRRVPPETEVYDPLGVAEEVQQSERWDGRGREASTG